MEQSEVAHSEADPLVRVGERQRQLRLVVPPERAVYGDQTVAGELASMPGRRRRGDGVALHARWQRHRIAGVAPVGKAVATLPMLVEHVAEAHVGDAGAADLS